MVVMEYSFTREQQSCVWWWVAAWRECCLTLRDFPARVHHSAPCVSKITKLMDLPDCPLGGWTFEQWTCAFQNSLHRGSLFAAVLPQPVLSQESRVLWETSLGCGNPSHKHRQLRVLSSGLEVSICLLVHLFLWFWRKHSLFWASVSFS